MRKILMAVLMVSLLLTATVPMTSAATAVDSITLVGTPALGATVSFTSTFSKTDSKYACIRQNGRCALVEVLCYQAGALVYGEVGGYLDPFKLGGDSSPWLGAGGGPASCTANLFFYDQSGPGIETYYFMATTNFPAAAE